MENKILPFALPHIGEEEINEVVDTLRSGWLTTGPKTSPFKVVLIFDALSLTYFNYFSFRQIKSYLNYELNSIYLI